MFLFPPSKGKTTIVFGKDKGMYLKHNSLTDLMPIFVVMRCVQRASDPAGEMAFICGTDNPQPLVPRNPAQHFAMWPNSPAKANFFCADIFCILF